MDKKKKIDSWLEKIYGKGKVPSYENTPECLSHLESLMQLSEQEEHGLEMIANLQTHQIAEFKEQTERMNKSFKALGFNQHGSRDASRSEFEEVLGIVSSLAESLDLDDPSEGNVNLAITDVRHKAAKLPLTNFLNQRKYNSSKLDLLDDLKLLNKSEKELINAKTEEKLDEQSIMSITKKYAFMQNKQKQYEQDQERYVTMIRKNGYDKAHSHEAIEDQKKRLDAIVERTKPIQTKLEGYRGLPASLVRLKKTRIIQRELELKNDFFYRN